MPKQAPWRPYSCRRPRPWCGTPDPCPVTAAIEEAEYGKNDQAADGEQHIPYGSTFRRLNLLLGTSINGAKITVLSAFLSCAHGAEIRIGQADKAHHSMESRA